MMKNTLIFIKFLQSRNMETRSLYDFIVYSFSWQFLVPKKNKSVLNTKDISKTYKIEDNIPVIFKSQSTEDIK
jgi:uncharacterized protein YbaR (Trm112 family)